LSGAIDGIKVVDLSRFIAGPYCGLLLADMGADVVKVEKPGGEDARNLPPFAKGESLYLAALNRNKRGVTLDYRHPCAIEVLTRLIRWADILIENFRPGTMEKMGFGPEKALEMNPGLIFVRCSGFGQTGPLKHRPGFDAIAQAMSGLMSLTGRQNDPPLLAGTFCIDYAAGAHAAVGALAALHSRNRTGKGQVVDVSLFETAVSMLVGAIPDYQLNGAVPKRWGNRDRCAAPCNAYSARDAWVYLACSSPGLWQRLCRIMGRQDLFEDPRFNSDKLRFQNVEELDEIVQSWVSGYKADELVAMMDKQGIPCAKVCGIPDIVNDPHLLERQQIVEVDHPTVGRMKLSGATVKFSETPGAVRLGPPLLGQHNQQVYQQELGYSEAEWQRMQDQGVC